MNNIILFRESLMDQNELFCAKKYFKTVNRRTEIGNNQLVIARYSCLPYYKELEDDCRYQNSHLINSYKQHRYIANMMNWYEDLKGLTPETWQRIEDIPIEETGPFILKGETNSKKFLFDTHFFAKDRNAITDVYCRLTDDGLIGDQSIYIRKFVPLKNYLVGLRGLPISDEYRFFCYKENILTYGYYWSNYYDDLPVKPYLDLEEVKPFMNKVMKILSEKTNAYVVDVARKADGEFIVIGFINV